MRVHRFRGAKTSKIGVGEGSVFVDHGDGHKFWEKTAKLRKKRAKRVFMVFFHACENTCFGFVVLL